VRWHLDHGLWLWHHWVDTTRSLDRRGSRMLFPKRWPLPLACRHRWEYGFGTSKATRRVRYCSHMHFSAPQHGPTSAHRPRSSRGAMHQLRKGAGTSLKATPAARNAHAGYLLTLAPASFVVRLSGLSYPALNYRRTPAPRPPAWHSHSRSNSHSPYAYAYTYTYICA